MPYKSNAQRKYFHAAAARGEIDNATVDEFDQASKGMNLPEKVKKQKKKINPEQDGMFSLMRRHGLKF